MSIQENNYLLKDIYIYVRTVSHGYQSNMQNDNLFKFVFWLIHATPDSKYKHRHKICETVKRLGKVAVLDELAKQGKDTMDMNEALIMIRTIKDCEVDKIGAK